MELGGASSFGHQWTKQWCNADVHRAPMFQARTGLLTTGGERMGRLWASNLKLGAASSHMRLCTIRSTRTQQHRSHDPKTRLNLLSPCWFENKQSLNPVSQLTGISRFLHYTEIRAQSECRLYFLRANTKIQVLKSKWVLTVSLVNL